MTTEIAGLVRFNSLIDASPMPTALYTGKDMVISLANQAMLDLWGKDSSVIGKKLAEALPELDEQPFSKLLDAVYISGKAYEAKEDRADLVINGKLQTFYFTFTYKPLKDTHGNTEAILNTAVDVTELVSFKQQISETEERLTFALSSAEVGTWDLDPINNKVNWNARCRELFGFAEEGEILYKDVLSCIHADDADKVNEAVLAAISPANKGLYDISYRTVSKQSGIVRWVQCRGKAYFNEAGIAYRFAGTAQDNTKEVHARRREQQLLSLVNYNADHMSVADMDGCLLYMNKAARKILGVAPDANIATLTAADFYTPEELYRVQNQIIAQIDEHVGWEGTIHLKNRITQEIIPCHVNYILIKDPETGDVIGRGATARDLRPEIKAKAELQRLATIVDISGDFCNYCDINGNTIYLNKAGIDLIGMDKDHVTETNMFRYHSARASELIKSEIMPQLLRKGSWSGALELVHQQTGEIIPIYKQLFIIREDISNTPIAFAGIARDLRPELNARMALDIKNAELEITIKELEFLANAVPAVVWTSKPDGQLDYVNERWLERSPKSIADSLGSGWTETIHPDDLEAVLVAWSESLATGKPYEIEFRLLDKYDNYRWWLVRALALKNSLGKIIKWYGSNTDITDQKELARQKDNFLGVASHELKTPITSLKAYAQVLENKLRTNGDEKNAELVSKMDKQLNRLTALIGDLLDVTKINTGRLRFNHESFNFNELVEEAVEDAQQITGRHAIIKQLNFKRNVVGDKDRINQVIINLLNNAIKYSPHANQIFVYTEDHDTEVQLCVQDFGIGINPDKKDKVFEQFYRVSGTREHTFPGLGLGLYISSEIVKRLGGRIWVNSTEGKGSTFCFAIPVAQSAYNH